MCDDAPLVTKMCVCPCFCTRTVDCCCDVPVNISLVHFHSHGMLRTCIERRERTLMTMICRVLCTHQLTLVSSKCLSACFEHVLPHAT